MVRYALVQPEDEYRENWEALGNAVVEQAAKDYLHALKILKGWSTAVLRGKKFSFGQRQKMRGYVYTVYECEDFFRTRCKKFTKVDGMYIRNKLVEASGMNVEMLNGLIEKLTKEENENESETGNGVRESRRTEDVSGLDGTAGRVGDTDERKRWSFDRDDWVDGSPRSGD